jgi:hypothetical protein
VRWPLLVGASLAVHVAQAQHPSRAQPPHLRPVRSRVRGTHSDTSSPSADSEPQLNIALRN